MTAPSVPLWSSNDVGDQMRLIDDVLLTLGKEMVSSSVPIEFKSGFADFIDEWKRWRDANSGSLTRAMGITQDKVRWWKNKTEEWRKNFIMAGGETTLPVLPSFEQLKLKKQQATTFKTSWIKWLVLAGATGLIGWFISREMNKILPEPELESEE